MVAENYHRAKNLNISGAARVADAISQGDSVKPWDSLQVDEDILTLFQVTIPCAYASSQLSSRPVYPTLIANMASTTTNKRGLPCSYDLLQSIENRIVKTLAWAPALAVAKEMASMHFTKMSEWDAIHTLAPIGRSPITIAPSKKDELATCLSLNSKNIVY
jgi:hypothetical protein